MGRRPLEYRDLICDRMRRQNRERAFLGALPRTKYSRKAVLRIPCAVRTQSGGTMGRRSALLRLALFQDTPWRPLFDSSERQRILTPCPAEVWQATCAPAR